MRQGGLIRAAGRVRLKKTKMREKTRTQTHHEIHSSLATAATTRRRATKLVSRVSLCSPASIYRRFVEIGLVQLSQSVKNTNVTHKTQTDRLPVIN